MSDHAETPSKLTLPSWFVSAAGALGSIVIMVAVLGIAYYSSHPSAAVDANVVAKRKQVLADVQAKQNDLYYNYSVVDQKAKVVRLPVDVAFKLEAAKLDAQTKDQPEPPARLSLAASPAGFVPPPPPVTTAPAAPAAAAGSAAASGSAAPAAMAP